MDADELAKPGRIVVPSSLGIAIGLEDRVGRHNLVLKGHFLLFLFLPAAAGHDGQVGDHLLGVLRLSGAGLASDQHCVVFLVLQHVAISAFSNRPEMWWGFIPSFVHVDLADPRCVDWVTLVWVDHDHKEARIGVDHLGLVASLQVPEDRGVVEEGQVYHVLTPLKLGRVDPANLSLGVFEY